MIRADGDGRAANDDGGGYCLPRDRCYSCRRQAHCGFSFSIYCCYAMLFGVDAVAVDGVDPSFGSYSVVS